MAKWPTPKYSCGDVVEYQHGADSNRTRFGEIIAVEIHHYRWMDRPAVGYTIYRQGKLRKDHIGDRSILGQVKP